MSLPVSLSLYMAQNIAASYNGRLLALKPPPGARPQGVALCLRFLNEARYLDEWISYYRYAGIEHFYLYNNRSDDDYADVLAPHVAAGHVTLIDWPQKPASPAADEDFIRRTIGRYEWVGVLDADEFIVIEGGLTIPEFLAGFKTACGVALHSYYFGSSGHRARPAGPVINAYTRRQSHADVHVKSFVRPEAVTQNRNAHCWFFRGARWAVNENGSPVFGSLGKPATQRAWINHYFCKSLDDYLEKALRRSVVNGTFEQYPNRLPEKAEAAIAECNDVEDTRAIGYFERLKIKMLPQLQTEPAPTDQQA